MARSIRFEISLLCHPRVRENVAPGESEGVAPGESGGPGLPARRMDPRIRGGDRVAPAAPMRRPVRMDPRIRGDDRVLLTADNPFSLTEADH